MILTAYFDESGTHDGSPVTVMGGLMGNAAQWARFEAGVCRLRKKHKFKIFHTKKFKARTGDFKGWTDGQCHALAVGLNELVETGLMEGVTYPVDNEAYERDYRGTETPKRVRLDSKYGFCFRMCLVHLVGEALRRVKQGKVNSLHVVLESGHPNSGDAQRIFDEMKKMLDDKGIPLLKTITLATKEECAPLLIADLIAHSSYEWQLQERSGGPAKTYSHTKGKTGVTHLRLPDGYADLKERVIADFIQLRASSRKQHA